MRTALFTTEQLLDAAEQLVADGGPSALTIERLTRATGASTGSIYHRFRSRSIIAAQLWIRAVASFHAGFAVAVEEADPRSAAVNAALHSVRWSREHPSTARMLLLSAEADMIADDLPEPWTRRVADANKPLLASLRKMSRRLYGSAERQALQRVGLALIDLPRGAVHRHLLARKDIPLEVETLLASAVSAVLNG